MREVNQAKSRGPGRNYCQLVPLWSNFDSLRRAPKRMSKKFTVILLQNRNFVEDHGWHATRTAPQPNLGSTTRRIVKRYHSRVAALCHCIRISTCRALAYAKCYDATNVCVDSHVSARK